MGQETTVRLGRSLAQAVAALAVEGLACQVVMVDGALVHPAQPVPDGWSEVRLRTPGGMMTLRRRGAEVSLVVFGNAGPDLITLRDRIAHAVSSPG